MDNPLAVCKYILSFVIGANVSMMSMLLPGRDQGRDSEELRQGRRLLPDPQRRQHRSGPAYGCKTFSSNIQN